MGWKILILIVPAVGLVISMGNWERCDFEELGITYKEKIGCIV